MSASDGARSADPHAELGVARGASELEIKSAWRRLAARWHPDRNPHPQAAVRMQRINEAYRQLGGAGDAASPEADFAEPPARVRPAWWERDWGGALWEADQPALPATLALDVALTMEQAAFGCTHAVKGSVADLCSACAGSGRLVSRRSDCRECSGEGRLRSAGDTRWVACAACSGDGAARQRCVACDATGQEPAARRYHFDVRIPPGMRGGQTVMLREQGQRGPGVRGDIELRIRIEPHALFAFDAGQRLVCRLPVDGYAVAGGGSAEVPVLGGTTVSIDLARGPLQVLEGMGFPNRDGSRGALVVETRSVTPRVQSASQRALLRQLVDDLRASGYPGCDELAAWHAGLQRWREAGSAAAPNQAPRA